MSDETRRLIELMDAKMGITPNMIKEMAISPPVLKAFYLFRDSLTSGKLPKKIQALITITVSEVNSSAYCLSAGIALAKLAGYSIDEIEASRKAENPDKKVKAVLRFAQSVAINRGQIEDSEIGRLRTAGCEDDEIIEIIGNVVLSIFANYFTEVSQTPIGFPRVQPATAAKNL
jgi:AhpD family alkylhydroperoxidase